MKLYSSNEHYKLYHGNMLDMLEVIQLNSIDAIITDPPYELNFMNKGWDNSGIAFQKETWQKCYEVLKSGGYLLAFGGSRTFHRIACAIEDAGFEIRDTIMWLYGSGFPKSMDISKQIDKRADNNNEVIKAKEELGKWLKEKRGNRLQKEISKYFPSKTGGLTGCVANWEKGYNLPTWEIWVKLKEILDLDDRYDYLIEGRPNNYIEAEREIIGKKEYTNDKNVMNISNYNGERVHLDITIPSTDLAKQWEGWGTALKPSFEPIIVARKPFKGSLVDNVIEYGVGGINIDECRVETNDDLNGGAYRGTANKKQEDAANIFLEKTNKEYVAPLGRFPANTILTYDDTDFDEVCGGFPDTKSQKTTGKLHDIRNGSFVGSSKQLDVEYERGYDDSGSASRYFMNCKYTGKDEDFRRYIYTPKASKKDRDEGLDGFEEKQMYYDDRRGNSFDVFVKRDENGKPLNAPRKNIHPTVKPTELMQYLVRLVSPEGATILDPFNGSGSTGKAVMYENKERNKNYKYIGIELTEEYLPISKARIEYLIDVKEEPKEDIPIGQMSIFDLEDNNE